MKDVEIIGMLKSYIKKTLTGMGALKGASCQIDSIVDNGDRYVITFKWEDNNGDEHTQVVTLEDGVAKISELNDVEFTSLSDEQILYWDYTDKMWKNANAGAVTETEYTAIQALFA